jgi:molybdopterin molybdotransferase
MLSYDQALLCMKQSIPSRQKVRVPLKQALGLVLAEAVTARMDLPSFHNAAVDGYAICTSPYGEGHSSGFSGASLRVVGRSEAGRPFKGIVRQGQVVRILTGAQIPAGANAVVMQEHVEHANGMVDLQDWPNLGRNVRLRGEDIRKGSPALRCYRVANHPMHMTSQRGWLRT